MKDRLFYEDPFLKGMIRQTDALKAPPGFVAEVMRSVEQVSEPAPAKGLSKEQLFLVLWSGVAASLAILFLFVVPGIFSLGANKGVQELVTLLPSLVNLGYSFSNLLNFMNLSNLMGVFFLVGGGLIGLDLLSKRSTNHLPKV
ncbi:MAG: hypothetical protein CSA95_04165 [Bacteroidetes bacterium]|nr:MAG: hypothetical protein CSA95_04165 [Bacteroidota bacterium]